jgi:hypothetical protein
MLIRSQTKWSLIPIANYTVGVAKHKDNFNICAEKADELYQLGEYSTEEKAIKVLDMAQDMYKKYTCRYGSDCSEDSVFQMPLDGDV